MCIEDICFIKEFKRTVEAPQKLREKLSCDLKTPANQCRATGNEIHT